MPERGSELVEIRREWWCDAERGVCIPRDLVERDSLPAGGKLTQVAECRVGRTPVFVVHAHSPVLSERARLSLAQALHRIQPGSSVALVIEAKPGHSTIDASPNTGSADVARAAKAVAVVTASWAWDDVRPIRVDCADHTLYVLADYDRAWSARVVDDDVPAIG